MLRRLAAGVSAALLVASCSSGEPAVSSSSTAATTTAVATTSSTTTAPTTSTTEPSTTSTAPAPLVLPPALGRDEIPWEQVGPGWYVVLYDSSLAVMDPDTYRDGPVGLYLVDREGRRYLVATWPADDHPQAIVDAVGTSVLVSGRPSMDDPFQVEWIDLITGERRMAGTADFPMRDLSQALFPRLVLPAGEAVTVYGSDGTTEWLERRSWDGDSLGVFFRQAYVESLSDLRWFDRPDGAAVIVLHRDGVTEVTPSGEILRDLWAPAETICYPVRWWDADTYLAACYGQAPGAAPLDDYGNLHTYYGRLWLLETDGLAGAPLTAFPADPPFVGDYGYRDAWPAGTETLVQWSGDCGALAIRVLQPDGSGGTFAIETPGQVEGKELIDVIDGVIAVFGWEGCDGWARSLFTVDLAGHLVRDLFPSVEDARGLATIYP